MAFEHDAARRTAMAAFAALPLGGLAQTGARGAGSRTLVAYFSRSGNTRVVAGLIRRAQRTDLFEIVPAVPYPQDYLETVAQARSERDRGHEPALAGKAADIAAYDTLYLGFPIWGETAPPVIRSFLSAHDLSGKTLIPFITHGGYGPGKSLEVLASHAPRAKLREGFVMEMDQERRTVERVMRWLGDGPGA